MTEFVVYWWEYSTMQFHRVDADSAEEAASKAVGLHHENLLPEERPDGVEVSVAEKTLGRHDVRL